MSTNSNSFNPDDILLSERDADIRMLTALAKSSQYREPPYYTRTTEVSPDVYANSKTVGREVSTLTGASEKLLQLVPESGYAHMGDRRNDIPPISIRKLEVVDGEPDKIAIKVMHGRHHFDLVLSVPEGKRAMPSISQLEVSANTADEEDHPAKLLESFNDSQLAVVIGKARTTIDKIASEITERMKEEQAAEADNSSSAVLRNITLLITTAILGALKSSSAQVSVQN